MSLLLQGQQQSTEERDKGRRNGGEGAAAQQCFVILDTGRLASPLALSAPAYLDRMYSSYGDNSAAGAAGAGAAAAGAAGAGAPGTDTLKHIVTHKRGTRGGHKQNTRKRNGTTTKINKDRRREVKDSTTTPSSPRKCRGKRWNEWHREGVGYH